MNDTTRQKLRMAQAYCDQNDKSTEFMLEYMQDVGECDLDTVLEFLMEEEDE